MSNYTPGPWEVKYSDDDPYGDIRIVARNGARGIAQVWLDDAPVHDYNREQEANARLIAAAPALRNAVRFLLSNAENKINWLDRQIAEAVIKAAAGE